ncbi:MAG: YqgE/AlgH family protein [Alphaproteobacteria bacterium]
MGHTGRSIDLSASESLAGQLLIAMPQMMDERFERTVIYMCVHNGEGAMGLVVNKLIDTLSFADMLSQLKIEPGPASDDMPVHFGGPVESGRGFVLHTDDYEHEGTLHVDDGLSLTSTVDVLKAISDGRGPRRSMLALGYAGWGPGQLESEIRANGWLHVPADENLLFDPNCEDKWTLAVAKLGIEPATFSGEAGRA